MFYVFIMNCQLKWNTQATLVNIATKTKLSIVGFPALCVVPVDVIHVQGGGWPLGGFHDSQDGDGY